MDKNNQNGIWEEAIPISVIMFLIILATIVISSLPKKAPKREPTVPYVPTVSKDSVKYDCNPKIDKCV